MEDLLNLEPTSLSRDLKGKFLLVYGEAERKLAPVQVTKR